MLADFSDTVPAAAPAAAPAPRMRLADLVADPATGKMSHARVWSNVGNAAATVLVLRAGWSTPVEAELLGLYLALVAGHALASKWLSQRAAPAADGGGK